MCGLCVLCFMCALCVLCFVCVVLCVCCALCVLCFVCVVLCVCCALCVLPTLRRTPVRRSPSAGPPLFPLSRPIFVLFVSLGLLVGILVVFPKSRDPQMFTFRLSCCPVKPRRLRGGGTRQPENSKRAHFKLRRFKHHQNSREDTQRETKKRENGGGRGKTSAKFWAPTLPGPTLRGGAVPPPPLPETLLETRRAMVHFGQSYTDCENPLKTQILAKNGLAKIGLAKVGDDRQRLGPWFSGRSVLTCP